MFILSTTQDVRQLKGFFPRLLAVKTFACSVNKYPVDSYRPRTVVGTRDAKSSQAGHIALFTDSKQSYMGSQRRSAEKTAGTDVGKEPATA